MTDYSNAGVFWYILHVKSSDFRKRMLYNWLAGSDSFLQTYGDRVHQYNSLFCITAAQIDVQKKTKENPRNYFYKNQTY